MEENGERERGRERGSDFFVEPDLYPLKSKTLLLNDIKKEKKELREIRYEENKNGIEKTNLHPVFLFLNSPIIINENLKKRNLESFSRSVSALPNRKISLKKDNNKETREDWEKLYGTEIDNNKKNKNNFSNEIFFGIDDSGKNDENYNNDYNDSYDNNEDNESESSRTKCNYENNENNGMNDSEKYGNENGENEHKDTESHGKNYDKNDKSNSQISEVNQISCTEIERLRISQLLREHEMNEKLKYEKKLMEERRIRKQLLLRSEIGIIHHLPKRRIPLSGFVAAPPPVKKITKKIPKYAKTPDFSKKKEKSPRKNIVSDDNEHVDGDDMDGVEGRERSREKGGVNNETTLTTISSVMEIDTINNNSKISKNDSARKINGNNNNKSDSNNNNFEFNDSLCISNPDENDTDSDIDNNDNENRNQLENNSSSNDSNENDDNNNDNNNQIRKNSEIKKSGSGLVHMLSNKR